jgi:adrenodoxin-NADP+ reductase
LYKATIIGQGNVALDCARILLSGTNQKELKKLSKTDVPESVLAELAKSSIRDVEIVGRRGPLQFAGTTKEIRELVTLQEEAGVNFKMSEEDMKLVTTALREMDDYASRGGKMENARMKKRLLGLMQKATTSSAAGTASSETAASWELSFCRSPIALLSQDGTSSGPISSIKYELNDLAPISTSTLPSNDVVDPSSYMARGTGQTVTAKTDFLLKSVGYRSIGIQGLPFDERKGVVRNIEGRIQDQDGSLMKGMYVSGWLARGPNGVIATTMYDAFQTAELMISDFVKDTSKIDESIADLPDLRDQGFGNQRIVSWKDWKAIDQQERRNGEKLGKEREKFVTVQDMLGVLG